ncbi:MAG: ComF family protein [Candidatus Yonathbacteria bacterium]|nr:ComF family protein [Candidatus Yonathbacteria bacterium]NTW47464.1 ComF family protein [Candidatus Yonathbacteria bacterium]
MELTKNVIRPIINFICEALFPSQCTGCGKIGTFLCDTCRASIPPAEPSADKEVRAVWSYRHPTVHRIIWNLKYEGIRAVAPVCAEALYDMIAEDIAEESLVGSNEEMLVIPIPLSRARLKTRGYNHTEDIARALVTSFSDSNLVLATDILIKTRDTKPQMSLANKSERLRNLIDAFTVSHSSRIIGRTVILIDDVTTTGATIAEARKTLRAAGAREVKAYAVAH